MTVSKKLEVHSSPSCRSINLPTLTQSARPWCLFSLFCVILLISGCESQDDRRRNTVEDLEWEEAEEDQQCEMVVKCKSVSPKTTSSPSASKQTSTPETSTYRVPLKPYGAPFNPMAEGGAVMWQKMGETPGNSVQGFKRSKPHSTTTKTTTSKTTTTTSRGDKIERDLKGKKANSLLGRKKIQKEKYLVSNDVTHNGGSNSQSDGDPLPFKTKPVVAFSVSLRTYFGHPSSSDYKKIHFDIIHSNIGDAFDVERESFIAPVEGAYFFTLTITARRGYEAAVDLVHNYRHVWTIVIDSDQDFYSTSWSPGSNSVVLFCEKGDRVYAQLHGGRFSNLEGSLRNSFTGFLI